MRPPLALGELGCRAELPPQSAVTGQSRLAEHELSTKGRTSHELLALDASWGPSEVLGRCLWFKPCSVQVGLVLGTQPAALMPAD